MNAGKIKKELSKLEAIIENIHRALDEVEEESEDDEIPSPVIMRSKHSKIRTIGGGLHVEVMEALEDAIAAAIDEEMPEPKKKMRPKKKFNFKKELEGYPEVEPEPEPKPKTPGKPFIQELRDV